VTGGVPAGAPSRAVTVRRTFARPREQVFKAWTDPDALVAWFGGGLAQTLSAAVDLRVGGAYRLTMQSGAGVAPVEGVYRDVVPPERLVYTWRLDIPGPGVRQSLVTVEFRDRDGATEVVITHEDLPTEESFQFHLAGWTASLERLGEVLSSEGVGGS
jgi:uncharacterized protein YndB with AHSA1/START domain